MKISAKKTQVIAEGDYDWTITDTESDNLIQLLQVSEYRYLGIDQKLSFSQTSSAKGQSMVAKAKKYRGAIQGWGAGARADWKKKSGAGAGKN